MSVSYRQGSKGRSAAGKAATVKWGSVTGKAAVLNYITAGGAVGVNYSTAGKNSRSQLAAGGSSRSQLTAGGSSKSQLAAGRTAKVSQLLIKQQRLINYRQGSKGLL